MAWETSARADADLVLTSLKFALASREVAPRELIHHADHGCQYTPVKLTTLRLPRMSSIQLKGLSVLRQDEHSRCFVSPT
ncbi:hypothetical protein ACWCQS_34520 [Streptomyces sp. NPDC002076]